MKIGICGLGERAGHVAGFLHQHDPRMDMLAYADPDPRGLAYLRNLGAGPKRGYPNPEAMLASEDVDLLIVGSPNHLHFQHIHLGLAAGLKVFTEKPVVISEQESWRLLELLKRYGVDNVMVGLALRYSPLYRDLQAAIARGQLGRIVSIEASEHLSPDHGAFFMRDWRRYEKYTGGFMLEKCCHDLDMYQGLLGCRPKRVASFGGRRTFVPENRHLDDNTIYRQWPGGWASQDKVFDSDADIVDFQTAIIEYENGVNLCFHSNIHAADKIRRFCVIGTRGMAEGDFERNYLRVHESLGGKTLKEASYEYNKNHGHYGSEERMAQDISAHLFDAAPLPVSILDAIEAGLIALKIDEARKSGQVIDLTETWKRFDSYGLR